MTRAFLGVPDDRGEPAMDLLPPVLVRLGVDDRREERVREADALAVQLDQLGGNAAPQPRTRVRFQRFRNEPNGWLRHRCSKEQRLRGVAREDGEPPAQKLPQLARHRKRLARPYLGAALAQRACKLESEERVAAGSLVHPLQRRP